MQRDLATPPAKPQAEIERLIARFNRTRADLIDAANAVPPALRDVPFVGVWDIRDVIAHTIGWDYTNLEALPDFASGRLPAFFAAYDEDWAAINAALVERYRVEDWDALLASLRDAQQAFVEALTALPGAALDNLTSWGGRRVSLRGMLRAVGHDEREHVLQIREFIAGSQP